MNKKTKKTVLFLAITLCVVAAIVCTVWTAVIMRNYDGYLEVMRAARREASPIWLGGMGFLIVGYLLTFVKTK